MNKNTNSISIVYSHPELIKEWHPTKNADLKPSNYTSGSTKKVWWLCQKGHEWQATINNRTYKHSGCPICYRNRICPIEKSFYSVYPELMKEWDYEKNSDINPKTIRPSQRGIRVWWICSEGHHWNTLLTSRVYNKTGCPICSGAKVEEGKTDIQTLYPELMKEWDYEKNKGVNPAKIKAGSNEVVWWKCEHGHEWQARIYNRTKRHTLCPQCTENKRTSFLECAYYYYINQADEHAIHKYFDFGVEIDIFIPDRKLCVEFDGYPWHKNRVRSDKKKDKKCYDLGFKIVRFRHERLPELNDGSIEIKFNDDSVEDVLKSFIFDYFDLEIDIDFSRDQFEIMNLYGHEQFENSLESKFPVIANQWNYEKNKNLTPSMIAYSAHTKVWWKCSFGHEWEAVVYGRTMGNYEGCPICSNRRAANGVNDLKALYPELMKEWDYSLNTKDPSKIRPGSRYKAWWKCDKGHSFQRQVKYRTRNNDLCPFCSKQALSDEYNLKVLFPKLIEEWDYELNSKRPQDYFPSSNEKVHWICPNKHKYIATIANRTKNKGTKCPYCTGKKKLGE